MKTYHIECMEVVTFTVEVEAQSEDEARELAREDINSFDVISEGVSEWEINLVEEIDNTDDKELTTTEQIDYLNSHLTTEVN